MTNPSIRPYQWFLLAVLLACAIAIAIRFEVDFTVMYWVARVDLSHVYGSPLGPTGGRFFYGPFALFFIRPLSFLSFPVAKALWIGLQTVAFLVFWAFLFSNFEILKRRPLAFLWIFVVAINPVHLNFQSNNVQLMILAVLMIAEGFSRRREGWLQYLAGAMVAAVSCIKIYPLFIAVYYWLVKKRMTRIGLLSGFVVFLTIPFLQFGGSDGLHLYRGFLHSLAGYHQDNSLIESFNIQCLPSLLARALPRSVVEGGFFGLIAFGTDALVGALFYLFVLRRRERAEKDERYETYLWTFALALMAFLNPSSFGHYLVFFIPAVCSLIEILEVAENRNWLSVAGLIVGTGLMSFVVDGVLGKPLSRHLQRLCLPSIGLIALCLALFLVLNRRRILE